MLLVDRRCHRIFQIDAFYCKCRVSILNFLKIIEKCCEKLLYIQRRFNSAYIYIYIYLRNFFLAKSYFSVLKELSSSSVLPYKILYFLVLLLPRTNF